MSTLLLALACGERAADPLPEPLPAPVEIKRREDLDRTSPPAAPGEPSPIVRFVAMGDGGQGNDTQYAVARAVQKVCAELGCWQKRRRHASQIVHVASAHGSV